MSLGKLNAMGSCAIARGVTFSPSSATALTVDWAAPAALAALWSPQALLGSIAVHYRAASLQASLMSGSPSVASFFGAIAGAGIFFAAPIGFAFFQNAARRPESRPRLNSKGLKAPLLLLRSVEPSGDGGQIRRDSIRLELRLDRQTSPPTKTRPVKMRRNAEHWG